MNIFVLCPDTDEPIGGVKILYKYVDALNRNGFDSFICHYNDGFRCSWFENDTRLRYIGEITHDPSDYWVIPEVCAAETWPSPGSRKVVLNQNCYYTFNDCCSNPASAVPIYLHEDIIAVHTVSEDSLRYLQYALPGYMIARLHYPIDGKLFTFSQDKRPRIAFMPRKNPQDAAQVLSILRLRGALEGLELVAIEQMSEAEVASLLGDSFLFLSFGYPEGFGIPSAEAMLSGCAVVGFHGMGASEYFRPEFSYPIACGDIVSFARAAEEVIDTFRRSPEALVEKARLAAAFIGDNYNMERFERDIVSFWRELLESDVAVRSRAVKAELLERWEKSPAFPLELRAGPNTIVRSVRPAEAGERTYRLERENADLRSQVSRASDHIAHVEAEEQAKGKEIDRFSEFAAELEKRLLAAEAVAEEAGPDGK